MVGASRGFVWELLEEERLLVSYSDDAGSDEQWQAYIDTMRGSQRGSSRALRIFAYAESTPPRTVLDGIMKAARGQSWRVAVISPSTAVRFAASTFSFVIRTLRFFAPTELTAALDHLDCTELERRKVQEVLARLRGLEPDQPR